MGSYEVVNAIDARIPSSAGNGTPFTLLAEHDTEGGTGPFGAEGTIQFLIDRADRNASYHEIISYEPFIQRFRVYVIVDGSRAAHSIAPQPFSDGGILYAPDAHVRAYLGINAWNPNQGVYAQSIAGRVADVSAYAEDRYFRECMHRRALELQSHFPTMKARAEHFRFNPRTRTDWGTVLTPKLGGLVIPKTLPSDLPKEDEITMRLRRKAEPWIASEGAKVYAFPAIHAPVLAILAGGPVVTVAEEAFYDTADNLITTGKWRQVLLTPDTDKIGWIQRAALKPITAPAFNDLVRSILWESELDNLPTFPLPDTSEFTRRIAEKDEAFGRIITEATKGTTL